MMHHRPNQLRSVILLVIALPLAVGCDDKPGEANGEPQPNGAHVAANDQTVDSEPMRHEGMCDASGAVSLGNDLFVVANDEDNVLRVYSNKVGGKPISSTDLTKVLKITPGREADFEGATRLGNRVYWMASHGRSSSGKWDADRHKFFATTITADGKGAKIEMAGNVYEHLLDDILDSKQHDGLGLAEASRLGEPRVPELNPKEKGINLEGLTATADGSALLIGLRNPRPQGKAIVLRLTNPAAVVDEGKQAEFGKPVLLDLGGLGIRSMEYSKQFGGYLISAGHHSREPKFALHLWSGKADDTTPKKLAFDRPDGFSTEAIIVYEGRQEVLLLSDDGTVDVDGKKCKDAAPEKRGFKSMWFKVGEK